MLPECQPELAAAIRHNARVTCASAAAHYGLWFRDIPPSTIWPATTATEPASSGTGPSGSMALAQLPVAAVEDVRCMPCRV